MRNNSSFRLKMPIKETEFYMKNIIDFRNQKRIITLFATIFFYIITFFSASAETTFSGLAGARFDLKNSRTTNSFSPELNFAGFFAGQVTFGKNIFLRTEFSVNTADTLDNSIFRGVDSVFQVDELSVTFRSSASCFSNYFTIFAGKKDPVGGDDFLKHYFGLEPISSHATENWLGLNSYNIFSVFGVGASYLMCIETKPIAAGLSFYYNKRNPEDWKTLNLDLRFAAASEYITIDATGGIGLPIESTNEGSSAYVYIDTLFIHTGLNLLLGNNFTPFSFLTQFGCENIPVSKNDDKKFKTKDMLLLLEPRFHSKNFNAHFTFYNLPEEKIEKTILLDDTFGFDMDFYSENVSMKTANMTVGCHALISFEKINLECIDKIGDSFKDKTYTLKLAPYVKIPAFNGSFNIMAQLNFAAFINDRAPHFFRLNFGYKKQF